MGRVVAVGISVLALGLAAAGCGGDEESLEPKAFARQANAVCLKANEKAATELLASYKHPKVAKPDSEGEAIEGEVVLMVPILIREAEAQLAGIGKLGAPSDGESQLDSILDAYRGWLGKAGAVPLQVVISNGIFDDARELAGKYGLAKCEETPFETIQGGAVSGG